MALELFEQIREFFSRSKHILIALSKNPNADAISAAVALFLFLKKQNKHTTIISDGFVLPKKLKFLPESNIIEPRMPNLQKFVIKMNIEKTGLETLSYDVKNNELHIFITPKQGLLTQKDLTLAHTEFRFDSIITIDSPDLLSLGTLCMENTDLFYSVPILNMGIQAENEYYGEINSIDLTKSSVSEHMGTLLKKIQENDIDEPIATALLTGMIDKTQSFKTKHVKPNTLSMASWLVGLGANRENIIHHLYQTKTLSTLKLWGKALSRLTSHESLDLTTTFLLREDFIETNTEPLDIMEIASELLLASPESKMTFILYEYNDGTPKIMATFFSSEQKNAKQIFASLHPIGDETCFTVSFENQKISDVENILVELLQKHENGV